MHYENCIMRIHKYQYCTLPSDHQDYCYIWSFISHILVEMICKKDEVGVDRRALSVGVLRLPPPPPLEHFLSFILY